MLSRYSLAMLARCCRRAALLALIVVMPLGCKRPTVPPAQDRAAQSVALDLRPLMPLLPERPTHLASDGRGRLWWVQEAAGADDVIFTMDSGGVPAATRLSVRAVAAAAGAADALGNIQSIAFCDDQIYFCFLGGHRDQVVACVGRYSPKTDQIRVLANTQQLDAATHMGASLGLARATLVCGKDVLWLWIHHPDAGALLAFSTSAMGPGAPAELRNIAVTTEGGLLPLNRDRYWLAAAADDGLVLSDLETGTLWRISQRGEARPMASLVGLPAALSRPVHDPQRGTLIFAGDAPRIEPKSLDRINDPVVSARYPALLIFTDAQVSALGRDSLRPDRGLELGALHLTDMVLGISGQSWAAYDSVSGKLVQLRWSVRD